MKQNGRTKCKTGTHDKKKTTEKINVLMLKYESKKKKYIEYAGHIAPGRARVSYILHTNQCEMRANLWAKIHAHTHKHAQTQPNAHQFRIPDDESDDDNVDDDRRCARHTIHMLTNRIQ